MPKITLTTLLLFLLFSGTFAQKINADYRLNIREASSAIIIDGILDEKAWEDADVATDFFMITPMDTSFARVRTDVRMSYDQEHLYLIVVNHHAVEGPYMVESLRRDFSFGKNEISSSSWIPLTIKPMDFLLGQMQQAHSGMASCPMAEAWI